MCIMHNIERTLTVTFSPGKNLYSTVRGILITNGITLNEWCNTKGLRRQSVEKALKGDWRGKKADELLALVTREVLNKNEMA
jgi:hypothetical protein